MGHRVPPGGGVHLGHASAHIGVAACRGSGIGRSTGGHCRTVDPGNIMLRRQGYSGGVGLDTCLLGPRKEGAMPKGRYGGKIAKELAGVPWITARGELDLTKFPIDSLLQQTLDRDRERCRSGCTLLGSMCAAGRAEAGVYLLGLLHFLRDDLERLTLVVENLARFQTPTAAQALLKELTRVRGSNATRRYLDSVLRALSFFPPDLVYEPLCALAGDRSPLTPRMRQKIAALLDRCFGDRVDEA